MNPIAIRNILDKVGFITESTGLAGRKPGAVFTDEQSGDTLTLNSVNFYPEEGGKFESGSIPGIVKEIETELGIKIQWENVSGPRTGGFCVATFTSSDDKQVAVGTYMQEIKVNATDNYVSNTILGRYKFAGKAAAKTQAGLTPQDLLAKRDSLSIADIMKQLATALGTDNPLYHVAHHVALGQPLPFEFTPPENLSFTAFRDYFCEILQPVALQKGLFSGNAGDAAMKFLDDSGFSGTTINFDSAKNAGLSDSILTTADGKYVKVSSKGNKGAEASVKNLTDSVDELAKTPSGKKILNKHAEMIDLIREIQAQGQSGAPLFLGIKYKVIKKEDADVIRSLKNSPPVNINEVDQLTGAGLTKKLVELAQSRAPKNPERTNLYYHLIAAVAHAAAEQVNKQSNFGEVAVEILNNGALVQVYTKAKEKAGKWILDGFESVYPGSTVSGVALSAKKNYSSTEIKGNFTFVILRGNAKVAPDDTTEETPSFDDDVTQVRTPGKRAVTTKGEKSKAGAGRERR